MRKALLGGIAGLFLASSAIIPVKAADIEQPIVEEQGLGWYVSVFGGYKWGDGDIDLTWERTSQIPCLPAWLCINTEITHEGELHGDVDDGWIIGGTLGAQVTDNIRAEIEVSHARLDTETVAREEASYLYSPIGEYEAKDKDKLRELFVLANFWFGLPLSGIFSPYFGGGVGVAHVNADFGVEDLPTGNGASSPPLSVSLEADEWSFAYQLGAGLLIGLSENVAIDIGYRFKAIPNIDLDDPEFCLDSDCDSEVEFDSDDDFDLHEHVAQIGIVFGF